MLHRFLDHGAILGAWRKPDKQKSHDSDDKREQGLGMGICHFRAEQEQDQEHELGGGGVCTRIYLLQVLQAAFYRGILKGYL